MKIKAMIVVLTMLFGYFTGAIFTRAEVVDKLLFYDGFNYSTNNGDTELFGKGTGWGGKYLNDSHITRRYFTRPGDMGYPDLATTNGFLCYTNGSTREDILGRALFTQRSDNTAVADLLNQNLCFGKSGTSIWASSLIVPHIADPDTWISYHKIKESVQTPGDPSFPIEMTPYSMNLEDPGLIRAGVFQDKSLQDGKYYWTLNVGQNYIKTSKEMVDNQNAFVVLKIEFTEIGGTINLYINPSVSDGPGEPDATFIVDNSPININAVGYMGNDSRELTGLDEIRIGTTYRAIAPIFKLFSGFVPGAVNNGPVTITLLEDAQSATLNGRFFNSTIKASLSMNYQLIVLGEDGKSYTYDFIVKNDSEPSVEDYENPMKVVRMDVEQYIKEGEHVNSDIQIHLAAIVKTWTFKILKDGIEIPAAADQVKLYEDGLYSITISDSYGKSKSISFTVDKTKPVVEVIDNVVKLPDNAVAINEVVLNVTDKNLNQKAITLNGKAITWPVSNKVSAKGLYQIKANDKAGNQTIKNITINSAIKVTSVKLSKTVLKLKVGKTYRLLASLNPKNATNKLFTWTSSKTSIATVSSSGLIKAKKAGKVTITVKSKDGSKTSKCVLTVTK